MNDTDGGRALPSESILPIEREGSEEIEDGTDKKI